MGRDMSNTAKLQPDPSYSMDDEVMDEMENNEATGMFEYMPDAELLADAEILDDSFLDDYDDFDATDVLEEEFGFLAGDE